MGSVGISSRSMDNSYTGNSSSIITRTEHLVCFFMCTVVSFLRCLNIIETEAIQPSLNGDIRRT